MSEDLDTEELLQRFRSAVGDDERQRLRNLLEGRQRRPEDTSDKPATASASKTPKPSRLKIASNGSVSKGTSGAVKLHFPRDGFMRSENSRFDSADDLLRFLRATFGFKGRGSTLLASMRRVGKYQRLDASDTEVFTFGDPILDLVTDAHGWITIGRDSFHMLPKELEGGRSGGLRSVDLAVDVERLRDRLVDEALSGRNAQALVEHRGDQTIVATTNPSEMNFTSGSARMRFRSWKKNYFVYRSIGSEIETWGRDFSSARIESMYADPVVSNDPFVCGITKVDSDSDTTDDYVDEYEVGIFASPAGSVRSVCSAVWSGRPWGGTIQKGDCQLFI
jgi:hypothetical protein